MKRSVLLVLLSFLIVGIYAQRPTVERENVVVEIGTGTWCVYCPGAAMGADDLVANGKKVAVIEYHNGDNYTNNYSNQRNTYYAITGFPTAFFDGGSAVVGGNATQSMYSTYLPKYNARIAVPSPITIDMSFSHVGSEYTVNVTVEKMDATPTNMVLHVALTESNIQQNWQNQTHLNFVERTMVPSANGSPLSFASGDVQQFTLNFTMNSSWVPENCELIAFVQNTSTKEILQGVKKSMAQAEFTYDANLMVVTNMPRAGSCLGAVNPVIEIQNRGAEVLTNLDINMVANNETPVVFPWTGTLEFLSKEVIELPEIPFNLLSSNNLKIFLSNPNGNNDQNLINDTITKTFGNAPVGGDVKVILLMKTDVANENSYKVLNSNDEVLFSSGLLPSTTTLYRDTFELSYTDCYRFIIEDAAGNGLEGGAFYTLLCNGVVLANGGAVSPFLTTETVEFTIDFTGISEIEKPFDISVAPNPFTENTTIKLSLRENAPVEVSLINGVGKVLFSIPEKMLNAGEHHIVIDPQTDLPSGIYYLRTKIGNQESVRKLSVVQ